jgi:DNA-binding LacI/PurR family transcriptional regulator
VQVAKAAGVSPTTVSHVLNNRGRISESTRAHVLQVVEQLSYRGNRHAQQLVTRRSRILAIQLPASGSRGQGIFPHSGYYLELISGACAAADELDYALIIVPPGRPGGNNRLVDFAVDGAVLVDPTGNEPAFDAPIPLATIGVPLHPTRPVASVDNDHRATARKLVEHLESVGRRRPLLVADRTHRSYVRDLVSGFREQAGERGVPADVCRLTSLSTAALDRVLDAALEHESDAMVASSDDIALGLLSRARRRGIQVPDQIMLASAVDASSLALTSPQITATDLYPRRTGATAVRLLVERVDHGADLESATDRALVPTRLVPRDSTRPSD